MHWIFLIHEFHNLSWITEINELFHDILIYWDAPVYFFTNVQPVLEICVPLWVISMPDYYCDVINIMDLLLNSALMTKSFTSQSNSLVLTIWVVLGQNNLQSRFDVYSQKSAANDLRGLLGLYPISISALLLLFGLVGTYTDWTGDMQPWGTPR